MESSKIGPIVDLSECLRDSPKFRQILEQNESDIDTLEIKIDKIVKLCTSMVDIGKSFIKAKSNFINGVWDLLVYFKDDPSLVKSLNRLVQTLTELLKYDTILIDQANRAVSKNLGTFIREDILKVKETKRHFDRISDDLDNVLIRNTSAPRSKPNEVEDANNILTATRSCFQHIALDYVSQISCLQSRKRHEALDSLLSLMHAYGTYFHQGSDLFQDFDPFKKQTAATILNMREETNALEKVLDGKHTLVTPNDIVPTLIKGDRIRLEGYLFKRTSNAFKTWNRRWFIIQDHQLVYQKRNHENEVTIMEEDLRLCTARVVNDIDRRFCFEVISPSKCHILQADSEESCQQWICALQAGIDAAYHNNDKNDPLSEGVSVDSQDSWQTASCTSKSSSNSINSLVINPSSGVVPPAKPPRAAHSQIIALPGNELCCDCGSTDSKWASINLGITLCIECSGIHRSLGVHVSKVRSLTLDAWDPELVKVMLALGNNAINEVYEENVDETIAKRIKCDSSRSMREAWIKAKYVKKAFVNAEIPSNDHRSAVESIVTNDEDSSSTTVVQSENISIKTEESHTKNNQTDNEESLISKPNTGDIIPEYVSFQRNNSGSELSKANRIQRIIHPTKGVNCDSRGLKDYYNLMLYDSASKCDLRSMCAALAKGAQINFVNELDNRRCPLHQAIRSDSVTTSEFLLLNGAKCNVSDANGQTPLHIATEIGNTGEVCLLLKRGADQSTIDVNGDDALTIAIRNANADIVTLLRLTKLNEEMKNDECGNPNDETINDVFRDFSQLASHSPEKLRRNNSAFDDGKSNESFV